MSYLIWWNVSITTFLCHKFLCLLCHKVRTHFSIPSPTIYLSKDRRIPHLFLSFSFSSSTHTSYFSSKMHALYFTLFLLPLHTHTLAVPTSTVDTEAATICSLTQTLTRLPQWVRITKLPRPMAQWEVTPPLLGWEGQLLTWEETEIELEDARRITLTGANWFVITF